MPDVIWKGSRKFREVSLLGKDHPFIKIKDVGAPGSKQYKSVWTPIITSSEAADIGLLQPHETQSVSLILPIK